MGIFVNTLYDIGEYNFTLKELNDIKDSTIIDKFKKFKLKKKMEKWEERIIRDIENLENLKLIKPDDLLKIINHILYDKSYKPLRSNIEYSNTMIKITTNISIIYISTTRDTIEICVKDMTTNSTIELLSFKKYFSVDCYLSCIEAKTIISLIVYNIQHFLLYKLKSGYIGGHNDTTILYD